MLIMFNGKFISQKNAKISILSESFSHGFGVFETIRTYGKSIFKSVEHIDRLFASAKIIGLGMKYEKTEVLGMLKKIVSRSNFKNQKLRITAIVEGMIVTSEPLKIDEKIYKKGVSCVTVECARSMPEVKSISYLASHVSHEKAVKRNAYEAILTDSDGYISEGAYSNIFWFDGEILYTPKQGVLNGITAKTVTEISPFKVKYFDINKKNIVRMDEVFLTQTTKGVVPIVKIDDKKIGNGKVGERTKQLMGLFTRYVSPNHF